jgi:hypothetical protein
MTIGALKATSYDTVVVHEYPDGDIIGITGTRVIIYFFSRTVACIHYVGTRATRVFFDVNGTVEATNKPAFRKRGIQIWWAPNGDLSSAESFLGGRYHGISVHR